MKIKSKDPGTKYIWYKSQETIKSVETLKLVKNIRSLNKMYRNILCEDPLKSFLNWQI